MKWSDSLRALGRGIKLVTRFVKAKLASPRVPESLTVVSQIATLEIAPVQPEAPVAAEAGSRLVAFKGFGGNPGNLRMLAYLPPVRAGQPLVVLLHGCGQDAAAFAEDSGWMKMADRYRFPLILPAQTDANNAGRCFQWFQPSDTARDAGEAASIANMAHAASDRFDTDPKRVFIVGLSAGAAMAVAMLAAYPDLFAAGASVAGLPVGAARSGMQAIRRMASAGPDQSPAAWAAPVHAAAPAGFNGPWPRLSIWQGQADTTVAPGNARHLTAQWRALHGLNMLEGDAQVLDGVQHETWPDAKHRMVESWSLPHLPHAYPAGARVVAPGRFVQQAPVDATIEIARFFGLE